MGMLRPRYRSDGEARALIRRVGDIRLVVGNTTGTGTIEIAQAITDGTRMATSRGRRVGGVQAVAKAAVERNRQLLQDL